MERPSNAILVRRARRHTELGILGDVRRRMGSDSRRRCADSASRILGTGDIVDQRDIPAQWARADSVYDLSDAGGLPAQRCRPATTTSRSQAPRTASRPTTHFFASGRCIARSRARRRAAPGLSAGAALIVAPPVRLATCRGELARELDRITRERAGDPDQARRGGPGDGASPRRRARRRLASAPESSV